MCHLGSQVADVGQLLNRPRSLRGAIRGVAVGTVGVGTVGVGTVVRIRERAPPCGAVCNGRVVLLPRNRQPLQVEDVECLVHLHILWAVHLHHVEFGRHRRMRQYGNDRGRGNRRRWTSGKHRHTHCCHGHGLDRR